MQPRHVLAASSAHVALLLLLVTESARAAGGIAPAYTITDLGIGHAYAINDNGEVAGLSGASSFQAFFYSGGVKTLLGTFGANESRAWGLNGAGKVVGSYGNTSIGPSFAFAWASGVGTPIPFMNAYDINDQDQIVGDRAVGSIVNAAIYQNGSITDLGTLGGNSSIPRAINGAGKVVGRARDLNGVDRAFLWNNGTMTPLYADGSEALDINNFDQVVGYYDRPGSLHQAALWQNGVKTDIVTGFFDSLAQGINDAGTVVGYAGRAFIWENGQSAFLNDLIPANSGWDLNVAHDINNTGQIVGVGQFNGVSHAFLLTPIPEPGFAGLGMMGLWLLLQRKRAS
jgi:probable HAF family extracellular repeat protein